MVLRLCAGAQLAELSDSEPRMSAPTATAQENRFNVPTRREVSDAPKSPAGSSPQVFLPIHLDTLRVYRHWHRAPRTLGCGRRNCSHPEGFHTCSASRLGYSSSTLHNNCKAN